MRVISLVLNIFTKFAEDNYLEISLAKDIMNAAIYKFYKFEESERFTNTRTHNVEK